jgi:5-methylcytosine-specific restriction enzyme subunit McrC
MILLHYSPDLHHGSNHVWTLMFDMNKLWEEFVFVTLRRKLTGCAVMAQKQKPLWESGSNKKTVRADIVVEKDGDVFVLDTKWKMPRYDGKIVPSDADLHQMYVYLDVYKNEEIKAKKVALLYPGKEKDVYGHFKEEDNASCDMLFLPEENYTPKSTNKTECREWQEAMANHISTWLSKY